MERRTLILAAALLLALCACAPSEPASSAPTQSIPTATSPARSEPDEPPRTLWEDSAEEIAQVQENRPSDLSSWFGDASAPAEGYTLLAGSDTELHVSVVRGTGEGPAVYVVGGVHGNEPAGWVAASLLARAEIAAGTLYILAPANPYGAQVLQRETKERWDLNRAFPGQDVGPDAARIAAGIYADIAAVSPALVLDLHEAQPPRANRDALGNSVICHALDTLGDLVLELLLETESGALCSTPFTVFGEPPAGSLNRTVTEALGIPVITVETERSRALEVRVRDQLDVAGFLLSRYGIC